MLGVTAGKQAIERGGIAGPAAALCASAAGMSSSIVCGADAIDGGQSAGDQSASRPSGALYWQMGSHRFGDGRFIGGVWDS